jgi:hypothetical protein
MIKGNQEKHALERAALKIFIKLYNRNHSTKLRLLYQRERPDAVMQDSFQRFIGAEITHLFYDAEEAKMLLGRSNVNIHSLGSLEMMIEELNARIKRKEIKIDTYVKDYPVMLIIRNASPIFGMSDILKWKHLIHKPLGKYTHIWFISRDGSGEWLMKDLNTIGGLA